MRLKEIFVYPIKSLGGIHMTDSHAGVRGFSHDRRWMLVDSSGLFLSQRTHPKMALLQTSLEESGLFVHSKRAPHSCLEVPFNAILSQAKKVRVWDDDLWANPVKPAINEWFQAYLGIRCELVYMPESSDRVVDPKYAVNGEYLSFADAMPYLLIGQSSLDDLNSRMETPIAMDRFRPNLVVEGCKPYEEDSWNEVRIGEVRFKVTKPCARCILTTVNQQTGFKNKEPLFTLSKYRTRNNKVMFGQNLICLSEGKVKVGDKLLVN